MTKSILFTLIFFFFISIANAQIINGKVIDSESNPVGYVNIGIVGKNIGTVSDENGNFTLELKDQNNNDTLKFSMIGFISLEFNIGKFKRQHSNEKIIQITLNKSITTLSEVTVRPKKYVTKIVGNTANSVRFTMGFQSNDLGNELGTVMKIKKSHTFIENVNFNIAVNNYDSVTFRLNIYKMENGFPAENILKEPIFVTIVGNTRTLSIDLKKYNLIVEDDFFVSLEWIKQLKGEGLFFCGGVYNADSYTRFTSQGNWEKINYFGLGFYTTVTYEK
jgi:hypothetical protein